MLYNYVSLCVYHFHLFKYNQQLVLNRVSPDLIYIYVMHAYIRIMQSAYIKATHYIAAQNSYDMYALFLKCTVYVVTYIHIYSI